MDDSISDRLLIQRAAGGSVIDYPPLFSIDGEILFIIRENTVRLYSADTGEWIRDLEEANANIVNIENVTPYDRMLLVGCTVNGDIITWKYKSGPIDTVVKMFFPQTVVEVHTFHVAPIKNEDQLNGLITWTSKNGPIVNVGLFDLVTGYQRNNTMGTVLKSGWHKVAVSKNDYNVAAIIQNFELHVMNYRTAQKKTWKNEKQQQLTAVACHPEDEVVAVGDVTGKIFIYHKIFSKQKHPINKLNHWHHTQVESIAFTASGSRLYSGGHERVLVGWNYGDESNTFLPRINGTIVHIALSPNNQKIAVSTDDNGIILINPQFDPISIVQSFTAAPDDKTPWPKFPIGLKTDPRTNSIVLNGRTGELQFYSTHTRSSFNLDTTSENRLSIETKNILYNTRITHSAINMDWLVTAECLDDLERFPEVRLKFWKFNTVKQSYVLNSQFESPHEGGVTALEFSSSFSIDNLLCASAGKDMKVKIWCLEETKIINEAAPLDDNVKNEKTRLNWICLETTAYKNLPVKSLAFSSDGSLLAVGYGNTLCMYIPETLHIKCVLSASSGLDGSANKLIVNIPTIKSTSPEIEKKQLRERRERIRQMVEDFLENKNVNLLAEILKESKNIPMESDENDERPLSIKEEKMLFEGIKAKNELNFFQKLELFQIIGIHIRLPADVKQKFLDYIRINASVTRQENYLKDRLNNLSADKQFIARYKLLNYLHRSRDFNDLHLKNVSYDDEHSSKKHRKPNSNEPMDIETSPNEVIDPIKRVAQINHVLFGTRECSHFVIVCTEKRLLIWNLLTLRLQATLKLSVKHVAVDPYTSLIAAFTHFDELYVFLPSNPYALYQRKNMPKTYASVWVPRRFPKQQSLTVNWQAQSQLYFLSVNQELLYLIADNDDEYISSKSVTLKEAYHLHPHTPFGAMIAAKQTTNVLPSIPGQRTHAGGLIGEPTKSSVKSLTSLQTHTMPNISLLCYEFLASLVSEDSHKPKKIDESVMNTHSDSEEEDDDDELKKKIALKKERSRQDAMMIKSSESSNKHTALDIMLMKMRNQDFNLKLKF